MASPSAKKSPGAGLHGCSATGRDHAEVVAFADLDLAHHDGLVDPEDPLDAELEDRAAVFVDLALELDPQEFVVGR